MSVSDAKPCATPGGMSTPPCGVLAARRLAEVEDLGRALGRAADAQVVQHDARPAERHVPVVGLVQVVVQADDAARRRGRPGSPGSSRARPGSTRAGTSRRRARACRGGPSGSDVEHAGDRARSR